MSDKITSLPQAFNANDVAPAVPMEPVPGGWYPVVITEGEVTPIQNGTGTRIGLEWQITEGQFKGRKIFDGLNIRQENPQAQEIAARMLSAICHATNQLKIADIRELYNRPHQIQVDVEAGRHVDADGSTVEAPVANGKTYQPKNRVRAAKAVTGPVIPKNAGIAPITPPAAPAPAVEKKGPRRPAKPKPAEPAAPPRLFWCDASEELVNEQAILGLIESGKLPTDTQIALENTADWKTPAEYGISAKPAAPAADPSKTKPWKR